MGRGAAVRAGAAEALELFEVRLGALACTGAAAGVREDGALSDALLGVVGAEWDGEDGVLSDTLLGVAGVECDDELVDPLFDEFERCGAGVDGRLEGGGEVLIVVFLWAKVGMARKLDTAKVTPPI
jgi:hypothetical protein